MKSDISATEHYWFWCIAVLLIAYRIAVSSLGDFNLGFDEAYYWYWSHSLDFGYYSKPPMLAWLIAATTAVCGDSEICVRGGSILAYPVTTYFIFKIAQHLFNTRTGMISALLFFSMPGTALGNILITTDAMLLLWWAVSLYLFLLASETNDKKYWLALGVTAGLGLMSKYNMALFALSVFVYLVSFPGKRRHLFNPWLYVAALISFVIFLPNVIWNIEHGNPTLQHTMEISALEQSRFHIKQALVFFASQLGVFGVLSFPVFIWLSARLLSKWEESSQHALLIFALTFLGVITLLALFGNSNANWAAPAYIAASILTGQYLAMANRHVLLGAIIALNILLSAFVYHYDSIMQLSGVTITRSNDIYKPIRGWKQLGSEVSAVFKQYRGALLLSDSRHEMAELIYYMRPRPLDAVKWNYRHQIKDHFDIVTTMDDKKGRDFIYVTVNGGLVSGIKQSFKQVEEIKTLKLTFNDKYYKIYRIYYLRGFVGYKQK